MHREAEALGVELNALRNQRHEGHSKNNDKAQEVRRELEMQTKVQALEEELAVGKQREAEIRFELDRVRQAKKEAECR